jgi:hypothetical protein
MIRSNANFSPLNHALADLVELVTFCLLVALVVFGIYVYNATSATKHHENTCKAPCAVEFPKGTQEDEFDIDWRKHTVHVFKVKP